MRTITLVDKELPYEIREEIKTLRTNIQFCGDDKRVIMFTSCISGEGKSETSLNLAKSFAQLDKRVLLIDTDLRKSSIADRVERGSIDVGLVHYLIGRNDIRDVMYSTNTDGLYIVPAGATPPNPSELLSLNNFDEFIDVCRHNFDYVIIDCAPLGRVVDASIIAPRTDGAILLVESGVIARGFAAEVAASLKNTGTPILGVVLNKVDGAENGKYGKYGRYGKYSRYSKYGRYGRYGKYERYDRYSRYDDEYSTD